MDKVNIQEKLDLFQERGCRADFIGVGLDSDLRQDDPFFR